MKLVKLLENVNYVHTNGNINIDILNIEINSANDCRNKIFIAIEGYNNDGHDYIDEAIKNGAKAVLTMKDIEAPRFITVIRVKDTRIALAQLSKNFFNKPDEDLTVIGITGTKGKTTTSFMLKAILEEAGFKVGLLGTITNYDGYVYEPSKNTTESSYQIYKLFRKMCDNGCNVVVMEVSSQGLKDYRAEYIKFDYAIFTNISKDHIGKNEHKSMDEYVGCKARLFQMCKIAVVNGDDEYLSNLSKQFKGKCITYGLDIKNNLRANDIDFKRNESMLGIEFSCLLQRYRVSFPGEFSVYNSLASISVALDMGIDTEEIKKALLKVKVPGRVNTVSLPNNGIVIVDYAHNKASLENVIKAINIYEHDRIITVFGCGGNRAKSRRFEMGEVSAHLSDLTIVTTDNPRWENPNRIIKDIVVGIKSVGGNYEIVPNRREAINYGISICGPNDILLIAGKGHETYQIIGDTVNHFDDMEIVREKIKEMSYEEI